MEKLIEMVGEKIKITSGDESVDAVLKTANRCNNGLWNLQATAAEKELSTAELSRGWMTFSTAGYSGLHVPTNDETCKVCGKRIEGKNGRLKQHIGNEKYDAMRAVKWIDIARPLGDSEKWAHPKCLHSVREDSSKWPAGIHYTEVPKHIDVERQGEAYKKLLGKGHDHYEAATMVKWEKGKEPAIIGQLLDVEKLVPEVGDMVVAHGETFILEHVRWDIERGLTSRGRSTTGAGTCDLEGGYHTKVTLLVRNGKVINKAYTL